MPAEAEAEYLFVDYRHLRCSDINWHHPETGESLIPGGPNCPPEPPVEAVARRHFNPVGVRLFTEKPAVRFAPENASGKTPRPGDIAWHEGKFISFHVRGEFDEGPNQGCYAKRPPDRAYVDALESADGWNWEIVHTEPFDAGNYYGVDGANFFIDPHAPADERYKIIYCAHAFDQEEARGWLERYHAWVPPIRRDNRLLYHRHSDFYEVQLLHMLSSPDGRTWTRHPERILPVKSDTDSTIVWDEPLQRYVFYSRGYIHERRVTIYMSSPDLVEWSEPEYLIAAELTDAPTDDIYTNAHTCYPGLPQYRFLFPRRYHRLDQTGDILFYNTYDGKFIQKMPDNPLLGVDEIPGKYDQYLGAGKNMVLLGPDEVGLPLSGTPYPHKYPRWQHVLDAGWHGYAVWPRGRIAGLRAEEDGEFFTHCLPITGKSLVLNVRTRRAGCVRVGLRHMKEYVPADDETVLSYIWRGEPVPGRSAAECDPIVGDHLDATVTWNGESDLGVGPEGGLVLHVEMRHADLFGFRFA